MTTNRFTVAPGVVEWRTWAARAAPAIEGARDTVPALLALAPVALALGASIAASPMDDRVGWAGGALVYAASAHATAVAMLGAGANGAAVLLAVLSLTVRGVIYSAGIVAWMREQPRWFRWAAPYLLVDPLYALVTTRTRPGEDSPRWIRLYYIGAGLAIWVMWMPAIAAGIRFGPLLPGGPGVAFALPALLIAFLVPAMRTRPAVAAAIVGGIAGVLLGDVPKGLALALASALGAIAAIASERRGR